MDIVKRIMTNIVKPFSHICNTSFISGIFPDNMKIAKVVPLCKAGENNLFTNYRPVSLLSQFSKILEKLFSKRLDKYIDNSSLLNSVSSRIQKGHGATNHWRHLIMPAGHPVDSVGHYQHPPPLPNSGYKQNQSSIIASYYHYVHKPLSSGIVS